MTPRQLMRLLRWVATALLASWLAYALVANVVLASGVVDDVVKAQPGVLVFGWRHAYSPWPGRVYVSGFRMSVEDPVMRFHVAVESGNVDVVFRDLLRQRFHASHAQARGVSTRLLLKVERAEGQERRLAAFPPIEGAEGPAVRPSPMPPFPSAEQLDALWNVQFDEVDATLSEIWVCEFRYQGAGRVRGSFALEPLRKLEVGPAVASLDGGEVRVGEGLVATGFKAHTELTLAPVDLLTTRDLAILEALGGVVSFDTPIEDLRVAQLYVDGLTARGTGRLRADIRVERGKLAPSTSAEAWLTGVDARVRDVTVTGGAHARLAVDEATPTIGVHLGGTVTVPLEGGTVVAEFPRVVAELVATSDELSAPPGLNRLTVELPEVRVEDAQAVTAAVASSIPFLAPAVLGNGPLVASASGSVTPGSTGARLHALTLGGADLEGAAFNSGRGWRGAAAGHFGSIPFGLKLHDGGVESVLFVPDSWLDVELLRAGLEPDHPVR